MPPKKAAAAEDTGCARFGCGERARAALLLPWRRADAALPSAPRRVRNNLKMGVVGLPNVGKSSLFNLLCEQSIAAVRACAAATRRSPALTRRRLSPVMLPGRRTVRVVCGCSSALQHSRQRARRCGTTRRVVRGRGGFSRLTSRAAPRPPARAHTDPFCTIEPNESRCAVPDERYDYLCGASARGASRQGVR